MKSESYRNVMSKSLKATHKRKPYQFLSDKVVRKRRMDYANDPKTRGMIKRLSIKWNLTNRPTRVFINKYCHDKR